MQLLPFSPKQAASIRDATERVNLWDGSVRSGKTVASLFWWANTVANHDGNGDLLMVGKTERTLKRNVIGPLTELLGSAAVSLKQGAGEALVFGKLVYLVGANDERAEQKIRGGTYSKIYGDEGTLWPESFFMMALSRMSTDGAMLGLTTNPDSPLHYIKRNVIDRVDELGYRRFHFTLRDNPSLSEAYIAAITAEYTGLWRKRFIEGLWVMAEGAIWDAFDTEPHTVTELPEGLEFKRYTLGIDYGTSNPFVALLRGDGSDGRKWVIDEWRWDSAAKQ
ncbi:MAG: PBSX family phage terminase large subunit, partial [Lysobacterales bacterium]